MKYYLHRTRAAYVTEVYLVNGENEAQADRRFDDGGGDFIGASINDYVAGFDEESREILEAKPHNLPAVFLIPE